ncbi:MAG: hypothetical protein WDA60_19525 [Acidimicrobiia bacterium]
MEPPPARDLLGYTLALTTCDPRLTDYLHRLYDAFPVAAAADHHYSVEPDDGRFVFLSDGGPIGSADHPEGLVSTLVNHCNRRAAEQAPQVLVHAGGVERDGAGVVLPASMESGKTTLTTGLVRAGFRYLSDEAVAIDRTTHSVVPYPKPMSLDPGSWPLFPELEPREPFATDGYKETQWQVPPAAIRGDAVGASCPVAYVVFPRYEAGATTELVPLTRGEALVEMAKNTFRFDTDARPSLEVLAGVVRGAEVYRLPNGSLDEAVACITELFGG